MIKTAEHYRPATKAELKKNPLQMNVVDRVEEIEAPDPEPTEIEILKAEIEKLKTDVSSLK